MEAMQKAYIGLDPGAKGYMAIQCGGLTEFHAFEDADWYDLSKIFNDVADRYPNRVAVIEDVKALHGASSTTTFSFGMQKGMLLAFLCATNTPFHLVTPQKWQKCVWETSDKVLKAGSDTKADTKATSIKCAKRLFPAIDFRKSPKCSKPHDGKCDAMLMSEYGRRNNL